MTTCETCEGRRTLTDADGYRYECMTCAGHGAFLRDDVPIEVNEFGDLVRIGGKLAEEWLS